MATKSVRKHAYKNLHCKLEISVDCPDCDKPIQVTLTDDQVRGELSVWSYEQEYASDSGVDLNTICLSCGRPVEISLI